MLRRALLVGAGLAWLPRLALGASALPALTDWAQAARRLAPGEPVIVLFSTPGCPHCASIRSAYLAPRLAAGAVVVELDITARTRLIDAAGRNTTPAEFAREQGVRMVPAVAMYDAAGRRLTEALVGADTAGFYEGYLESALAQARRALARPGP